MAQSGHVHHLVGVARAYLPHQTVSGTVFRLGFLHNAVYLTVFLSSVECVVMSASSLQVVEYATLQRMIHAASSSAVLLLYDYGNNLNHIYYSVTYIISAW